MDKSVEKDGRKITIGILAHVDAGKTTLSEQLLLYGGAIRKAGRVDHGDSFLDDNEMERSRGITIYSKEARLALCGRDVILLDTPGHIDFSAEMERALSVMDYAILLISAADGVTAHTQTLWELLRLYGIPVFIFVNKMDRFQGLSAGKDSNLYDKEKKDGILGELTDKLSGDVIDFSVPVKDRGRDFAESLAVLDEELLERFIALDTGNGGDGSDPLEYEDLFGPGRIADLIYTRKLFPCFFGSALKGDGLEEFIAQMVSYLIPGSFPAGFGARIYKISHDPQGQRLVHIRMTGGSLAVRDEVTYPDDTTEKVTQIRLYSGSGYTTAGEVHAGDTCVLCGLTRGSAGDGLGFEKAGAASRMTPVLSYRVKGPDGVHITTLYEKLHILEEESPELSLSLDEDRDDIYVLLMGQVQSEILKSEMERRFGIPIELDEGRVVYRETITSKVEGVGHFEPLRHYAEVHLLLEPGKRGSGMVYSERLSSDLLATNWKRLILQHLNEKQHRGVLTGSPVTDIKVTLVAGRAHPKHTEGGDFRQATYRAVRQGLMQADSILLEPWYSLQITIPSENVGRVLTDLEKYNGSGEVKLIDGDTAVITGRAPVSTIRNYAGELAGFTSSRGRVDMRFDGYDLCHNAEEVIENRGYDPERDVRNRSDSVFCIHGAGQSVSWDEVFSHMHLPQVLKERQDDGYGDPVSAENLMRREAAKKKAAGEDELREIFEKTYRTSWDKKRESGNTVADFGEANGRMKIKDSSGESRKRKAESAREKLLLVDGYNVIHADSALSELAGENFDAARGRLLDMLSDFHGSRDGRLIVVFDAYKVPDGKLHEEKYHNIEVVYTKQAQTADMYIEKTVGLLGSKYMITVATSDGLEQIVTRGQGAMLISSRELLGMIAGQRKSIVSEYASSPVARINPVVIPNLSDPASVQGDDLTREI